MEGRDALELVMMMMQSKDSAETNPGGKSQPSERRSPQARLVSERRAVKKTVCLAVVRSSKCATRRRC